MKKHYPRGLLLFSVHNSDDDRIYEIGGEYGKERHVFIDDGGIRFWFESSYSTLQFRLSLEEEYGYGLDIEEQWSFWDKQQAIRDYHEEHTLIEQSEMYFHLCETRIWQSKCGGYYVALCKTVDDAKLLRRAMGLKLRNDKK